MHTPKGLPDKAHAANPPSVTPSNSMFSIHLDPVHLDHTFDVTDLKSCYYEFCNNCLQKWSKPYNTSRDRVPQIWPSRTPQDDATIVEWNNTITYSFGDGINMDKTGLGDDKCDCEFEANGCVRHEERCKDSLLSNSCNENRNMYGPSVPPAKTEVRNLLAGLETTIKTIDDWSSECQDYDAFDDYMGDRVIKMDPDDTVEFSRGLRTFLTLGSEEKR